MQRFRPCCLVFLLPLPFLALTLAGADETDLSNGVLICHHPPGIVFSSDPPSEGWCQHYLDNFAIHCCESQHPRIDVGPDEGSVWYVIAAWDEDKELCGVAFGFADYDEMVYRFHHWGPCFRNDGLEISTDGWPGPNQGTAFVPAGDPYLPWVGNMIPLYYFTGYAYYPGVIPLGPDPDLGTALFGNCNHPVQDEFEVDCLGAMGLFTDGSACLPAGGPSPTEQVTWGRIKQLYR